MDYLPLPNVERPAMVLPLPKLELPTKGIRTGYPLRGSFWTHPGEIHSHLLSGEHAGKWPADWVRSLTTAEAESLHSDDHEGRVRWSYVPTKGSQLPLKPEIVLSPVPKGCPAGGCPDSPALQRRGILGLFR